MKVHGPLPISYSDDDKYGQRSRWRILEYDSLLHETKRWSVSCWLVKMQTLYLL